MGRSACVAMVDVSSIAACIVKEHYQTDVPDLIVVINLLACYIHVADAE